MTKKTFFLLALALVFAFVPSLEAQTTRTTVTVRGREMPIKTSWDGRTLDGMPRRGGSSEALNLFINNVEFGRLHGGGDNRVVEIRDGNNRVTGKTTVDKIQKNDITSGIRYIINLSANHYLEITGIGTESGGLVGKQFYVIRGPTELYINYTDRWPNISIGFPSDYDTMVYENWAEYKSDIVGQFVDEYIMPMVSYAETKKVYNEVRLRFWEYFNTTDTTKYNVCPENIGCLCGGNIPQHIIYGTTMKQGLMAGLISGVTDAFGNFVGDKFDTAFGDKFTKAYGEVAGEALDEASETVFKKVISDKIGNAFGDKLGDTAEAILRFEENSTRVPTVLAAIIGYHYGYYPDETAFNSRFRDHAAVLYSDAPFSDGLAKAAGKALRVAVDFAVDKIGDLMGIKLLTSVVSFAIDGISAAWDVSNIGYRADRFFQANTVVNWVPPAVTTGPTRWTAVPDSTFTTYTINSVAYGNNTWVAVGAGGMIAYSSDNGIKWTAVPAGTGSGQTTFPSNGSYSNISAVAFGNGKFVAVGSGRMATSPDGRAWKAVNSPLSGNWKEITFGGGRFVVVGDSGATAYSADGEYWTSVPSREAFRTLLISNNINDIAYGGGKFVAVGGGGKIGSSSNGQSWTNVANSAFGTLNNTINGIAYGNSKWVAAGQNGKMAYSDNGVSWNAVAVEDNGEFGTNTVNGVGFGNNRFVAVGAGGKIAFSQDGGGWKAVPTTGNGGFGAIPIRAVAWGNGRFIAVGQMGKMAYSDWGEQTVIGERSGGGHVYSGPPAPAQSNVYNGNGHSYEVFNLTMSWTDARRYCEERGGYLATVTSSGEQAFIEEQLRLKGDRDVYWLGGYCESDRVWKWVTGERFEFTNWYRTMPDNDRGIEDKLEMYRQSSRFGQWNDDSNNDTRNFRERGFICEWDRANGGGTPTPPPSPTGPLDGVWASPGGHTISINGSNGFFIQISSSATYQDAIRKGYIKNGDQRLRNLRNTSGLTWTGDELQVSYTAGTDNATGTRWVSVTITLSADGQTFRTASSGGSTTYTKQR